MTEPTPQKPIDTPAALRDEAVRLHGYLSKLDKAMAEAEGWIEMRRKPLVFGAHWLEMTIKKGREKEATDLLTAMGDMAGLMLSFRDFEGLAKKAFGPSSPLLARMKQQKNILPDIFALPPQAPVFAPVAASPLLPLPPPPPPEPEKKWWQPKTWLKKKPEAPQGESPAEATLREWQDAKDTIMHMQEHRQFYVDSFLDWMGETLAPENPQAPKGDELMLDYLQPQRIATLAEQDYRDRLPRIAREVALQSNAYGRMAALLDDNNLTLFASQLYPKTDTAESREMRKLLLEDYGAASFTELALARRVTPQQRQWLLKAALEKEPDIVLSHPTLKGQVVKGREAILRQARQLTYDPQNGHDRDALRLLEQRLLETEVLDRYGRPRRPPPSLSEIFDATLGKLERTLRELYYEEKDAQKQRTIDRYIPPPPNRRIRK